MSQTNFENNSFPVIEDQVSLTNGDHRCNVLWNVSDVTVTGENKFWVLTYSERNKFIAQNPNWKELEYE